MPRSLKSLLTNNPSESGEGTSKPDLDTPNFLTSLSGFGAQSLTKFSDSLKSAADRFQTSSGYRPNYTYEVPEPIAVGEDETVWTLLEEKLERGAGRVTFSYKNPRGGWVELTTGEYVAKVNQIAKGLISLGVNRGDHVSIMAHTSIEWSLCDLAATTIGAIVVPVYETSSAAQVEYIRKDSDVKLIFVENSGLKSTAELAGFDQVFSFEDNAVDLLTGYGAKVSDAELAKRRDSIKGSDVCTVVYTSGSTGNPKGCVISHRAMVAIAKNSSPAVPEILVDREDGCLMLFLPLAHGFARFLQFAMISCNVKLAISGSIATLLDDLKVCRPTFLLGVPRIFEKVFNAASQNAGSGATGAIFKRATRTAIEYSKALDLVGGPSLALQAKRKTYDALVYTKIRQVLGGNIDYIVSGGAPLNSEIAHFFRGAGLEILEGYGMTETIAPIMVNRPTANKIGTIGRVFPAVELRVADDGELLIRSPYNFEGYHNMPKETRAIFSDDEGNHDGLEKVPSWQKWIHSGDQVSIDEDQFVKITGRIKELIVTAGGKNVSPAPLEAEINVCSIVDNSVVIGDNKPFIAALITLDSEELAKWLKANGLDETMAIEDACSNPAVLAKVQEAIDKANLLVSRAESIRKFIIVPDQFTEANGMLTASLKIRRRQILEKFQNVIDAEIY